MKTVLFINDMCLSFEHNSLSEKELFLINLQKQIDREREYNDNVRYLKNNGIESFVSVRHKC